MSFRRRKGMGGEASDGDRSGEPDAAARGRGGGDGRGTDSPLRRWALGAALALAAAGAGYLMAAELLFPASSPAESETLTPVPDLRGSQLDDARARLEEAGLALRVSTRAPAAGVGEDEVLAQRPVDGQLAAPGDTVSVTVADAERPLRMPALRSLREDQARRVLERMGFAVATESEAASVPRGEVVRTVPPAGEAASPGSEVRMVLSEGPPVSGAPELLGRHFDDVGSILADSGLALGAVSWDTAAIAAPGRVVSQSPPPGFSLREGERVGVRVAGSPPEDSPAGGAVPDTADGGR